MAPCALVIGSMDLRSAGHCRLSLLASNPRRDHLVENLHSKPACFHPGALSWVVMSPNGVLPAVGVGKDDDAAEEDGSSPVGGAVGPTRLRVDI